MSIDVDSDTNVLFNELISKTVNLLDFDVTC